VPLFTSSSECTSATTGERWLLHWVLGIVVALSLLAFCEIALRTKGFMPSAPDDCQLWALERRRANSGSARETLVLVGASRIRLGIDTDLMRRLLPGKRVVQLAILGQSPYRVLQDLANDKDFHGTIIYDFMERYEHPQPADQVQSCLDYYHRRFTIARYAHVILRNIFSGRFVVLSPQFDPRSFGKEFLARRGFPKPHYITYLADRSMIARPELLVEPYDLAKQALIFESALQRMAVETNLEEWLGFHKQEENWIQLLHNRGAEVVLLRMPSSGRLWMLDEAYHPKASYWDQIAATTLARTIHFKSLPGGGVWEQYDESHLDARQAGLFTMLLVQELRRLGVVDERPH